MWVCLSFSAVLIAGCVDRPLEIPEREARGDLAASRFDLGTPPDLLPPAGMRLALNQTHGCVRVESGQAKCWGVNDHGELGDGTTLEPEVPSLVPGLADVLDVAVGDAFSCALERKGRVWCWGANNRGQLGDGTTTERHSPVAVALDGSPVQLAAGNVTACALFADGSAACWGANDHGEMGDGTCGQDRLAPSARVQGLSGATQLSVGNSEACARLGDGTLRCWGSNRYAGLGVAPVSDACGTGSLVPVMPALSSVVEVTVQLNFGCAVLTDRTVRCWGVDVYGMLGDQPAYGNGQIPPVQVTLPPAVQVAATSGSKSVLALLADGTVMQWGDGIPNHGPTTAMPADLYGGGSVQCTTSGCCSLYSDGNMWCLGAPGANGPF